MAKTRGLTKDLGKSLSSLGDTSMGVVADKHGAASTQQGGGLGGVESPASSGIVPESLDIPSFKNVRTFKDLSIAWNCHVRNYLISREFRAYKKDEQGTSFIGCKKEEQLKCTLDALKEIGMGNSYDAVRLQIIHEINELKALASQGAQPADLKEQVLRLLSDLNKIDFPNMISFTDGLEVIRSHDITDHLAGPGKLMPFETQQNHTKTNETEFDDKITQESDHYLGKDGAPSQPGFVDNSCFFTDKFLNESLYNLKENLEQLLEASEDHLPKLILRFDVLRILV